MTTAPPPPCPRTARALLPIGLSDFRKLRTNGFSYVDKTDFVADFLAAPGVALLFARPRRFGKTLNLSTLRCFVEKVAVAEP